MFKQDGRCFFLPAQGAIVRLWVALAFCFVLLAAVAGRPQERGRTSYCLCVGYKKCDGKKSNCSVGVQEQQKKTERVCALLLGLLWLARHTRLDFFAAGLYGGNVTEKFDAGDKNFWNGKMIECWMMNPGCNDNVIIENESFNSQ